MSSDYAAQNAEIDPANRLLWRMRRRRLEVEPLRDAILAMGDNLDLTVGGGIFPTQGGYVRRAGRQALEDAYNTNRRAIYVPVIRNAIYPMFATFDYADSSVPIPHRASTTIPSQSLFMMNSRLVLDNVERFAKSLLRRTDLDEQARIETAYIKAYAREPEPVELRRAIAFLNQMRQSRLESNAELDDTKQSDTEPSNTKLSDTELYAWTHLCQVILEASEFIHIN